MNGFRRHISTHRFFNAALEAQLAGANLHLKQPNPDLDIIGWGRPCLNLPRGRRPIIFVLFCGPIRKPV
jgi:hypothetical protein